ncbi:sensor histidine kinase [Campylobacterota bacterium]
MNNLEKKSFYSFLALYSISSFVFITLSGYWYYTAQKSMFESNQHYRLQHIADTISEEIIHAHMEGKKLQLPEFDVDMNIALIDVNDNVIYGSLMEDFFPTKAQFFEQGEYSVFISDAPMQHLDIKFVMVQSKALFEEVNDLKQSVSGVIFLVIMIMITLAWILSKLFMRPLHQKIEQIEGFVHDTAHELNTPITALSMSVSRALKKREYDEKILKNISISTKQLFDIYSALSYISFESKRKEADRVDVSHILKRSVAYYKELSESKKIEIDVEAESFMFVIDETKLTMLFGNLISNAIKYSMPDSTIHINLKDGIFTISDQGIGIDKEKLSQIFERYNRQTEYAGGFGIGLSIVQKVCQEYGISIDVSSEKDKGTTFVLRF